MPVLDQSLVVEVFVIYYMYFRQYFLYTCTQICPYIILIVKFRCCFLDTLYSYMYMSLGWWKHNQRKSIDYRNTYFDSTRSFSTCIPMDI